MNTSKKRNSFLAMASIRVNMYPDIFADKLTVPKLKSLRTTETEIFTKKYVLSVAAATIAEISTYPLDIVKTRLQIQSELKARRQLNGAPKSIFELTWGK